MEIKCVFFKQVKDDIDAICQDAYAANFDTHIDLHTGNSFRIAIADGASSSIMSGDWADILCQAYVNKKLNLENPESMLNLSNIWKQRAESVIKTDNWYAKKKLEIGSHSTFLGIEIKNEKKQVRLKITSVGDSCLFHYTHAQNGVFTFPLQHLDNFDNSPDLIESKFPVKSEKIKEKIIYCEKDDNIVLATDALSSYLMKQNENIYNKIRHRKSRIYKKNSKKCKEVNLYGILNENFIKAKLKNGDIKNDDITFVWIKINQV